MKQVPIKRLIALLMLLVVVVMMVFLITKSILEPAGSSEAADVPTRAVTSTAPSPPALMPPWQDGWRVARAPVAEAEDIKRLDELVAAFEAAPSKQAYLPLQRLLQHGNLSLVQKQKIWNANRAAARNLAVEDAKNLDALIERHKTAPGNDTLFRFENLLERDTEEDLIPAEDEARILKAWLGDAKLPPAQTPPDVAARMEALLQQFIGGSTGAVTTQELLKMIHGLEVSPDDARKIVAALWRNSLVVRDEYAPNEQPCFEEVYASAGLGSSRRIRATVDGTDVQLIQQDGFGHRQVFLLDWRAEKPGRHELVLEYAGWGHAPGTWAPVYRLRWQVSAVLNVVEDAASVRFMSGPQLDRQMKAAFTLAQGDFSVDAETVIYDYRSFVCKSLPMPFAYRETFRDAEGKEHLLRDYMVIDPSRATMPSHSVSACLDRTNIKKPGTYSGTLILTTNKEKAKEDPSLQSVWDGTIELPLRFEVRLKEGQK